MKTNILKTAAILVLALSFVSFTSLLKREVKVQESTISWKGYKVTGSHEGTISLKDGSLVFEDDQLTGGNFSIDMTSINVTDLEAGSGKEKLEGHLKSDDFFGIAKYPNAMLTITKVEGKDGNFKVTGDLTVKGETHPTTFDMMVKDNTATATVKIDRTKYGIRYGSASFFDGLKDKAIYDEFDLNVMLKF
ncbi:Polyisoprenoid-binding protein YceI [Formosa sp. Hel1_31_208]|uniref:YceI family protein n=1 Tax=Formosa sp. Hel1_31_208 TaxID=1798225 RepID=UPI00087D8260|nr:YceI family protein [Formosa sp. Hel1_31_208]SDS01432.1 Polyisoprenoid-binding protein YceI [Formosa sp. Hel1_31_208]